MKTNRTLREIMHNVCNEVGNIFPPQIGGVILSNLFWRSVMHKRDLAQIVLGSHRRAVFDDLVQICDLLAEDSEEIGHLRWPG